MPGRRVLTIGLALLLGATLLGVIGYEQMGSGRPAGLTIGGPFSLVDGDGKTVSDQDFRGKVMLVYFGYTHCPDACPTALNQIAVALDKLGAKAAGVRALFITVDPERDTPSVMKDYVAAFGNGIMGLTGTPEQVHQAEASYRVYAAKHPVANGDYDMDHSSIIYVMGRDGRFVTNFSQETTPDEMSGALNKLL